jgi:hypothetical protein
MSYEGLGIAIMRFLSEHRGRGRAVPRQAVEDALGPFVDLKDVDRAFRKAYSQLPICSCPDGLFIPQTVAEVAEFKRYLTAKSGPFVAHERVIVIYQARPELVPEFGVQMSLYEEA